jgi:hypothetical protein
MKNKSLMPWLVLLLVIGEALVLGLLVFYPGLSEVYSYWLKIAAILIAVIEVVILPMLLYRKLIVFKNTFLHWLICLFLFVLIFVFTLLLHLLFQVW